jgi:glyoxylase-like metal-dependent hydrolase (beta-lactamase superfamily II)
VSAGAVPLERAVAEPVAAGIWRVGGGSWGGAAQALSLEEDANSYLIAGAHAALLVDCGTRAGGPRIAAVAGTAGAPPATDLLLTHSHWDHTGGAAGQQGTQELTTHLNAVGAAFLDRGDERLVGHQLHGPAYRFDRFRIDHAVQDGERFLAAGIGLAAQHLPGHSPDSTLFTFERDGETVGISGDIAFAPRPSVPAVLGQLCSLWLSNLDDYVASLARLERLDLDRLLPGHGRPIAGRAQVRAAVQATRALAEALAGDPRVRANLGV